MNPWMHYLVWPLVKFLVAFIIVQVIVAAMNWIERRLLGFVQARLGPNRVGPKGLLQIIAEITGCGELALDELLERGRQAIDGRHVEVLPIRQGRETVRVPVASIEWIDAAGDYMCIHAAGDTHILRGTMKELEEILDPKLFQRVHRSTIVNLRLVRSLRAHMNGEYFLTLEGGHELKLSRSYRDKIEYFLSGSAS